MTTARWADSSGRLHIVLVPGFAGFDALGQLEYYAGVTDAYQRWLDETATYRRRDVVLHYFDNLPTAAVATRAERLRAYLAKRIARGEIQPEDTIALVGHSTGGLDIRRMLFAKETPRQDRVLQVDGGDRSNRGQRRRRGAVRTAVEVRQSDIFRAVDCLVFLSVPQWGTNIADWTRDHGPLQRAVVEELHLAVEAARRPRIDKALTRVLGLAGHLACDPDLVLAAQDALRETTAPKTPPGPRADAQLAGSQLRLWLQHAVDDFAAIDDLAANPPKGSVSPAHYSAGDRQRERRLWRTHSIRTMSFATVGQRPFSFQPGRPVKPLSLTDPATWPNHGLVQDAETTMDISYLAAYRTCAGGPFGYPPDYPATGYADLDTSLYEPSHLGPDGQWCAGERIEVWDNDGIVNTASMLWPNGPDTRLVAGDHGDIIGHYTLRPASTAEPSGRRYASYDLLKSGTGFTDDTFGKVWDAVFGFCAGIAPPRVAEPTLAVSRRSWQSPPHRLSMRGPSGRTSARTR